MVQNARKTLKVGLKTKRPKLKSAAKSMLLDLFFGSSVKCVDEDFCS